MWILVFAVLIATVTAEDPLGCGWSVKYFEWDSQRCEELERDFNSQRYYEYSNAFINSDLHSFSQDSDFVYPPGFKVGSQVANWGPIGFPYPEPSNGGINFIQKMSGIDVSTMEENQFNARCNGLRMSTAIKHDGDLASTASKYKLRMIVQFLGENGDCGTESVHFLLRVNGDRIPVDWEHNERMVQKGNLANLPHVFACNRTFTAYLDTIHFTSVTMEIFDSKGWDPEFPDVTFMGQSDYGIFQVFPYVISIDEMQGQVLRPTLDAADVPGLYGDNYGNGDYIYNKVSGSIPDWADHGFYYQPWDGRKSFQLFSLHPDFF